MSATHGGPFVAWTSAWMAGSAAYDHVLGCVAGTTVHDERATGERFRSLGEVLIEWRRLHAGVRLVLPVPGDVRGLGGPDAFRSAALDSGEAVQGGGLGLVPTLIDNSPSSAPPTLVWQLFDIEPVSYDEDSPAEAQQHLAEAIRECAGALAAAQVAGWSETMREPLADARRAGERLDLPPGFPPRAVQLIAQAERLAAVLDVAAGDEFGGAIDRFGIAARASALRPLATAVRRGRVAGYNALSA